MFIALKVIQLAMEGSPLPYVPAFAEWNGHVGECVQCAHVDQLAAQGEPVDTMDLCEGGSQLQLTVQRRMHDQHAVSMWN